MKSQVAVRAHSGPAQGCRLVEKKAVALDGRCPPSPRPLAALPLPEHGHTQTRGLARGGTHSCLALPRGAAGSRLSSLAGPLTPKANLSVALPRPRREAAGSRLPEPRESPGAAFLRLQALARDQVQAPGAEARWNHPRTNFLTKDSPHLTISFPSATALTCCLFQTVSSRGLALSLSIFYSGEGSDTCLRT